MSRGSQNLSSSHGGNAAMSPGGTRGTTTSPSRSERTTTKSPVARRRPGDPPAGSLQCTIGTEKRRQDVNTWFSSNRRTPAQSRLGRPLYLPCDVTAVRPGQPEPPFGSIVDVVPACVNELSSWTPRKIQEQIYQQISRQSGLYRTTTKRGSKAHTVWDSIWEKPVERTDRILAEMHRQREVSPLSEPVESERHRGDCD
jgi:hypothetical protein